MDFNNNDHYFNKNLIYKNEGISILNVLLEGLTNKKKNALLKGMQEGKERIDENQYLQHAVESTINYFFKTNFDNFIYEPEASIGKKNMDCGIEFEKLKMNFEIKCPYIVPKEKNVLYLKNIGFDSFQMVKEKTKKPINEIKKGIKNSKDKTYDKVLAFDEIGGAKNKSLDLLTLLKETQLKSIKNEINILIVSLYSKDDFSEWTNYYWDIIIDDKKNKLFENIDGIILTNTINHHINNCNIKSKPWLWNKNLSFYIRNPFKKKSNFKLVEEKIGKIFGKNSLLLQKEMISFDKNLKNKTELNMALFLLKINRKITKRPIIYSNEYICKNAYYFKKEIVDLFDNYVIIMENKEIFDFEKKINDILIKIKENSPMIEERIERLFLCKKIIDKIEKEEGKTFFNNDMYIYIKQN